MERGCPFDEPIYNPDMMKETTAEDHLNYKRTQAKYVYSENIVIRHEHALDALEILRREHKKEIEFAKNEIVHKMLRYYNVGGLNIETAKNIVEEFLNPATKGGTDESLEKD